MKLNFYDCVKYETAIEPNKWYSALWVVADWAKRKVRFTLTKNGLLYCVSNRVFSNCHPQVFQVLQLHAHDNRTALLKVSSYVEANAVFETNEVFSCDTVVRPAKVDGESVIELEEIELIAHQSSDPV